MGYKTGGLLSLYTAQRPLLENSIDRVFKKLYSLIYKTLMEIIPYGRKEKRRSIRQRD